MEQMYLIEIFIDKVTVFVADDEEASSAQKRLIIKVRFGPKTEFIIKEGQLTSNETQDEIIAVGEDGKRKWTRVIRVGKSYLFPSYPDTLLTVFDKFPLELEVWNDDAGEENIYVGQGTMIWDTNFYHCVKETTNACKNHESLSIKSRTAIFAECCCRQCGEIDFIFRLSPLGHSIMTEFQQPMNNPEEFVFRTNRAPSMFKCKRIEGDDPNFCMVGSLYETTTLEDPEVIANAKKQIEVCTEQDNCERLQKKEEIVKRVYPIEKIRMGDITGPCGNANCPLAHKVKMYIRQLDSYKKQAKDLPPRDPGKTTKHVCGACVCKDDKWHRDTCPTQAGTAAKDKCEPCGGTTAKGETCSDKERRLKHGESPTGGKNVQRINYVYSITKMPDFKESMFGREFLMRNLTGTLSTEYSFTTEPSRATTAITTRLVCGGGCKGCSCADDMPLKSVSSPSVMVSKVSTPIPNATYVYNVETKKRTDYTGCTDIPDSVDCRCSPPKPSPPCKATDCECIAESINKTARKTHKPFCPLYKHKVTCPVRMLNDEEEKNDDYEDNEEEPLPYGLPPVRLGPCPVMGRPCTVPDGFARMYKNAAQTVPPPSYSDAGKVCCSKEYERIKKAIAEYMKYEKGKDLRCINKFNVDTETRCCDKEQVLLSLTGKSCCGAHKLSILEKK